MRRSRLLAAAGTAALVAVLAAPPALADEGPTGSAYALSVRTTLLDRPLVKIDPLPAAAYPKGGNESVVEVGPNLAGLVTAKVLNAKSRRTDGGLASAADLAEVSVQNILRAKLVTAECEAGEDGVTGRSSIAELSVLGQKIDVKAKVDVDVLGVATVKINEQVRRGGMLTVNAVHVTIGSAIRGITSADVVLSQAKCATDASGGSGDTPAPTSGNPSPTEPSEPGTTGTSTPTTTTDAAGGGGAQGDVPPASETENLAETGVSTALPIALGGVLLLAAGAGAVAYTRRRAAVSGD